MSRTGGQKCGRQAATAAREQWREPPPAARTAKEEGREGMCHYVIQASGSPPVIVAASGAIRVMLPHVNGGSTARRGNDIGRKGGESR